MRAPGATPAERAARYAAALDMAAWADEGGLDSVTLSEHHGSPDGYLPSPLSLAGAVLGRTRRIRVGVAALLLPLHNPVRVAEDLVVLDLASDGRVGATLGQGYRPEEYALFGRDWAGRGRRFDACIDVLLRALRGEAFEWEGRPVHVTPGPLTQPHPPLFVGGMGRNAARRAARFGLPFQPAVATPEVLDLYRSECERRGTPPVLLPPGSGQTVFVSEDPDRTWAAIGRHLLHEARAHAAWQPEGHRSAVHSDAATVDTLRAEGRYVILTPEQCLERARRLGPLADFILHPLCGGTPPDEGWRSLRLYTDQVLPHL